MKLMDLFLPPYGDILAVAGRTSGTVRSLVRTEA